MNCECGNISERNGKCASCNREQRRAEKERLKPKKVKRPIEKVGIKNTFECSDGEKVTQAQINYRLNKAYDDAEYDCFYCFGCGAYPAEGHAHIIPKARCKQIGKTELIWNEENFFPACNVCNSAIENPKGQEWKKLKNIKQCLAFIKLHDEELYQKFQYGVNIGLEDWVY